MYNMIWIIALLSLLIAVADVRFYRRHVASRPCGLRIAFIAATTLSDTLPLLISGIFFFLPHNTTATMMVAMWAFFVYLITVLPRLAFYFFRHFGLHRTGVVVAACTAALLLWGATYGRTNLIVNEVELRSERLPASFDGLRIVQFSDTHIGTLLQPARELQRLADTINALHPDLVIFSGDLVNIRYTELDTQAMRILGGIKAPLGVISNLGNHDIGVYVKDTLELPVEVNTMRLIERQRAMGWRLPDNATEYLVRDGDTITVSGISFDAAVRKQRHDRTIHVDLTRVYEGVPKHFYNITVSHLPQLWEQVMEQGYGDLTLSGHVHAMQLSLNLGACRLSPARLLYTRWSGLHEQVGRYLYINDGIGYVGFPMRLGARPEITVITLRR